MMNKKNRIDENMLEEVTGGVIFNATGISWADQSKPWEVLNDYTFDNVFENGQKMTFATYEEAKAYAIGHGYNFRTTDWNEVQTARSSHR